MRNEIFLNFEIINDYGKITSDKGKIKIPLFNFVLLVFAFDVINTLNVANIHIYIVSGISGNNVSSKGELANFEQNAVVCRVFAGTTKNALFFNGFLIVGVSTDKVRHN